MSAAIELGRHGVTANLVHPPITDSGWVTDAVRDLATTSADHAHVADPTEVGGVIAWLCSAEARMVTGNVIRMR
jgi:3-oxoacyl-[acyl-carrier protein] reductase